MRGLLSDAADWAGDNPLDAAALATSPIPIVGDVVGGVADAKAFYDDPSWMNAGLGLAGLLPFVPGGLAGTIRAVNDLPMDQASRMARADELFPIEAYTGANRLDRLLEKPGLDPSRATSGPMPYFTDSPELASSYAKGKSDNSRLLEGDGSYGEWFKAENPKTGGMVNFDTVWNDLPASERVRLRNELGEVGYVDDEYTKIGKTKTNVGGASKDHWDYTLRQHRGNALAAARDLWLDSGNLFGKEDEFMDVLKQVDFKAKYDSPHLEAPGVLPARLRMKTPFVVSKENMEKLLPVLEKAAPKDFKAEYGVDMWAKNAIDPQAWLDRLKEDIASNTDHTWTIVPDWVTEAMKKEGYDGIMDQSGKFTNGPRDTVYIPFGPEQVRSRFAKFDPSKLNSSDILAGVAGAGLLTAAGMRGGEERQGGI